jgi:hypothetical protein
MERNRDTSELGLGKGDEGDGRRRPDGPLDGSTSGTVGGGGREQGGSTARPTPPDMPATDPENAASGRRTPHAVDATEQPDDLGPGPSDVSQR